MANGWFLLHAARPLIETAIELAAQLALNRGSCRGIVEAA